jgi:3-oxoacyl-ACP reductase-like protein
MRLTRAVDGSLPETNAARAAAAPGPATGNNDRETETMNTDRVVVVTGAAGGMGALIVKGFFASGDTVFATTSNKSKQTVLAASFRAHVAASRMRLPAPPVGRCASRTRR